MKMLKNKKGQGAREYLMTYGWAILFVLVVLICCSFVGVGEQTNVYGRPEFSAVNSTIDLKNSYCEDASTNTNKIINASNAYKAKAYIAHRYNRSIKELKLPYDVTIEFPLTKRKIWKAKIIDNDGNIYGVTVDEKGDVIDNIDAIEVEEKKEYVKKYGKIEPSLWDKLQSVGENVDVGVAIWLTPIDSKSIEKDIISKYTNNTRIDTFHSLSEESQLSAEEIEKIKEEIFSVKKEAYKDKERGVIQYLANKKKNVTYGSIAAPLVFATMPKHEIFALAERDDVSMIFSSEGKAENMLDSAVPTIRASPVWDDSRCKASSNIKIGVIDVTYGIQFDKLYGVNGYNQPSCQFPSSGTTHATEMAKILVDKPPDPCSAYKGVDQCASQTVICGCGSTLYSIIGASDWALNQGANILSCSFGIGDPSLPSFNGAKNIWTLYYDHIVSEHSVVVVAAAGNSNWYVTPPALAYNVLAVGGTDDKNTRAWSDDTRWYYNDKSSNYKECYNFTCLYANGVGDGNKPEVSAVAIATTALKTSDQSCSLSTSQGTSNAAPLVAGEVAMMMATDWSNSNKLRTWPMVVRALVMATATHNTYNGPVKGGYDDLEGVGTVVVSDAYNSIMNYQDPPINMNPGYYKVVYKYDQYPYTIPFIASQGEKVRFVISWDSYVPMDSPDHIVGYGGDDILASDIDLLIYDPDGNLLGYSNSWDNNYEVVDFIAPKNSTYQTGKMYTARLQFYRFNTYEGYEVIGAAWSRKPFIFNGTVEYWQDSPKHTFNVYSGSDVYVNLSMPLGADFDLSVWDNLNRRTGGWTSTDYTTLYEIPNSGYSGYSVSPEWVNVLPSATTGTWKTGCFAYSNSPYGNKNYSITVNIQ